MVPATSRLLEQFSKWGGKQRKMELVIPLNPVPASRPRVGRWGVHYLKTYATWKKQAVLFLPDEDEPMFTGPLAVLTEFIVKKPKTTKRAFPRGDTDNYEKAAWDAVTQCGAVWTDDDLILTNLSHKRFANEGEEPNTRLLIIEL